MQTEQQIQTKIAEWLRRQHWLVTKVMQSSLNGWPDLLAVREGEAIFIEVKRPGGVVSKIQSHRIEQLRDQEMKVYITDSLSDLIKQIQNPKEA
jgi:Holliday junction resolvase